MYTKDAQRKLGVASGIFSQAQMDQVDDPGYISVENVLCPEDSEKMRSELERIHAAEEESGGHEVRFGSGPRQFSSVFNKTEIFDKSSGK